MQETAVSGKRDNARRPFRQRFGHMYMQEPKIANKNLDVLKPVLPTPWTRKQQAENAWRTSFLRPLQNTHFEDLAFHRE